MVDLVAESVPEGRHQLENTLYVVVLAANEGHCALKWILPQAADTSHGPSNLLKVVGVTLRPFLVHLDYLDFRVEILIECLFEGSAFCGRIVPWVRLHYNLYLAGAGAPYLHKVLPVDTLELSRVVLLLPPIEALPVQESVFEMELSLAHVQGELLDDSR